MIEDGVKPEQRTNPTGGTDLQSQDWAEVAKTGIGSMTPADKGWVLAVVIMFLGMTAINYFTVARQSDTVMGYLANSHELRKVVETNRAEEIRRAQEVIKTMAETVSRQTDRVGRMHAEEGLLREFKESELEKIR